MVPVGDGVLMVNAEPVAFFAGRASGAAAVATPIRAFRVIGSTAQRVPDCSHHTRPKSLGQWTIRRLATSLAFTEVCPHLQQHMNSNRDNRTAGPRTAITSPINQQSSHLKNFR